MTHDEQIVGMQEAGLFNKIGEIAFEIEKEDLAEPLESLSENSADSADEPIDRCDCNHDISLNRSRKSIAIDEGKMATASSGSGDSVSHYLHEIGHSRLLSAEEEKRYAVLAQSGDLAAREKMLQANLRLVIPLARRYAMGLIPFADLISEGNLGLMHALSKFDPSKGFRFSTYATWWIRQFIERSIMNHGRIVRLPVYLIKQLQTYRSTGLRLMRAFCREASAEEIAQELKISVAQVHRLIELEELTLSIDEPLASDSERSLVDLLPEQQARPEKVVSDLDFKLYIAQWIAHLEPRYRDILERRFGLCDHDEPQTLEEVGNVLSLTRERVRQLQIEGLQKLKVLLESHGMTADCIFEN